MGGWYNGRLPGHSASNQVWFSTDGKAWEGQLKISLWAYDVRSGELAELATRNPPAPYMPCDAVLCSSVACGDLSR